MNSIKRLLGPLAFDGFRRIQSNREPVYFPGDAATAIDVFSVQRFYECLRYCEDVRAVFPKLLQARIAPNDATQMFEAGATICATGLEQADASLAAALIELKSELHFTGRLSFRAYHSPPGQGFAPHYDPRMVTAIQITGTKKWSYATKPVHEYPMSGSPIPIPDEYELHMKRVGTRQQTLSPGDILCLPAGTIHWAEAVDCPSLALNLAFDYIGESVGDRVARQVRETLLAESALRSAPFLPLDPETAHSIRFGLDKAIEVLESYKSAPNTLYD